MERPKIEDYIRQDPSELTTGEILISYQKYAKALDDYIEKQLNLSGVIESVLCIDSKMHNFITVGEKYEILQKDELSCIIVNDVGIQQVYKMNCFKKL